MSKASMQGLESKNSRPMEAGSSSQQSICSHTEGICLGTCHSTFLKSSHGITTDNHGSNDVSNQNQLHMNESSMKQDLSSNGLIPSSAAMDYLNSFQFSMGGLDFGSEMAGLEYGFLSDMVQTQQTDDSSLLASWPATSTPLTAPSTQPPMASFTGANNGNGAPSSATGPMINVSYYPTYASETAYPTTTTFQFDPSNNLSKASSSTPLPQQPTKQSVTPIPSSSTTNNKSMVSGSTLTPQPQLYVTPPEQQRQRSPLAPPSLKKSLAHAKHETHSSTLTTFNKHQSNEDKPYNYADGFHYLIQYVKEKMGRDDLIRISKALAKFRPSFLVLIMNLTEEDLIFMEKCIQRTLLEYEKLISFSGTPTVVWRRTGEICLLGKEFCLLTQWTKELLSKKTYIYELMDCPSAVEYWEHFGRHAFDNTDTSRHYTCILQSPKKRPIPCTFCFMIKRDIFDLPSVIVGNFLPILS